MKEIDNTDGSQLSHQPAARGPICAGGRDPAKSAPGGLGCRWHNRSMGLSDDARSQINSQRIKHEEAVQRERDLVAMNTKVIDSQVPEFVTAARELGIEPTRSAGFAGLFSKRYWFVAIDCAPPDAEYRNQPQWLTIFTDGTWIPSWGPGNPSLMGEATVPGGVSLSPAGVRQDFTAWLAAHGR